MPTLSADVTSKMKEWIDEKVKSGTYKSRSEVIREMCREKMEIEKYSKAAVSKAVSEIPDHKDDWHWKRVV